MHRPDGPAIGFSPFMPWNEPHVHPGPGFRCLPPWSTRVDLDAGAVRPLVCAIGVLGLLLFGGAVGCRRPAQRDRPIVEHVSRLPQSSGSPRDAYVQDSACAECHAGIAESFAHHPMGRSLGPIDQVQPVEDFTAQAGNPFDADGYRYHVRRSGNQTWHVVSRIAQDGQEMATVEKQIDFVVGSGNRGRSYLYAEDDLVYMSPITWYPDRQKWDLSPGYEVSNQHFRRGVIAECLFCHANHVDPVDGTVCRYRQPIFDGYAIGCQRCHGPGKAHVEAQQQGTDQGTIVNPAKLSPQLREQVCQQCHLSTAARILRPGKQWSDYRPGQPLEDVATIFTWSPQFGDTDEFVGQVEQMYSSRCFLESDGRLGCISCHDPHQIPEPSQRVAYYRQRCLNCHAPADCGLPEPDRLARVPSDSCYQCHMPARDTDLRHVASTDHRILRRPEEGGGEAASAEGSGFPLIAFPPGRAAASVPARDRAIAVLTARVEQPDRITRDHIGQVIPDLRQSTREAPDDWPAWEALGYAWITLGRSDEALKCFQTVLRSQPLREFSLASMGQLAFSRGDFLRAADSFQSAYRLNPNHPRYAFQLAQALAGQRRWNECLEIAENGVRKFPENIGLRQMLIESYLQLDNPDKAAEQFAEIERFQPEQIEEIRQWYESQRNRSR